VADPYTPADDSVVLATVPRAPGLSTAEIRQLRLSLEREPADAAAAARLAQIYSEMNSSSGEPRYLGYASAILAPWRDVAAPPARVWLIRARVAQRLHQFEIAQADLEALLQRYPGNSEAALLLSTVSIVRADYQVAQHACASLAARQQSTAALVCGANLSPYVGQALDARDALDGLLEHGALSDDLKSWVLTLAAELAVGCGAQEDARRYYADALAITRREAITDLYLLGSYADFLTDQGEPDAALELLASAPATDALLIRQAVATTDAAARRQIVERLRTRIAALVRRGDDAHAREIAWGYLHVFGDAPLALTYAQRNWQQQHEMRDARLLLEAALAAHAPAAATSVVDWIEGQGIHHVWLDPLVEQVSGSAAP
jgi:hypothetical protein